MKASLSLLHLEAYSIFEQLQLEEALLRADGGNWCLINTCAKPSIVMGISGKSERLLHIEPIRQDEIPIIRRFSGGGTVYIDEETLFVTFICNGQTLKQPPTPYAIMEWSKEFYAPVFSHPHFDLRENDYVMGQHKFGGNAQYIQKERWLHHTSFLWDYSPKKMEYLRLPDKRPTYRKDRSHDDFLCKLKDFYPSKELLIARIKEQLARHFNVLEPDSATLKHILKQPHRKSTSFV